MTDQSLTRLRQLLVDYFSDDELRTLCFDLRLNYEALPAWRGWVGGITEALRKTEGTERAPSRPPNPSPAAAARSAPRSMRIPRPLARPPRPRRIERPPSKNSARGSSSSAR